MSSARRRGLGDVLHYFIPEEEQRGARLRARAPSGRPEGGRIAWALLCEPERPLDRALARDLALALVSQVGRLEVLAPFGGPHLDPPEPRLRWTRLPSGPSDSQTEGVEGALASIDASAPVLLAVPCRWLARVTAAIGGGRIIPVLPVEAVSWGVRAALGRIRQTSGSGVGRMGLFLIGSEAPSERGLLEPLERAARRQLGTEVLRLGSVLRDATAYRALLADAPVVRFDPGSASANSLTSLARTLVSASPRPRAATP